MQSESNSRLTTHKIHRWQKMSLLSNGSRADVSLTQNFVYISGNRCKSCCLHYRQLVDDLRRSEKPFYYNSMRLPANPDAAYKSVVHVDVPESLSNPKHVEVKKERGQGYSLASLLRSMERLLNVRIQLHDHNDFRLAKHHP
jgi:hypothetical protein